MTALELSQLLCMSVDDAQDFIDRCDEFDSEVEALYDLEDRPRTIDDYDPEYLDLLLNDDDIYPCACCVPQS